MRALSRQGVQIEAADWRLAGRIKADERLSLADAYAVALAYDIGATLVVGADDDFDELPLEVECRRFRDQGV